MGGADGSVSPLVLDLTGAGLNLTPLSYVSPYFDLSGSGFAHKTGWIGSGTGLLCIDTNGDGKINSGLELFGTAGGASDGFAALSALDTNGDGVIDSNDAQFADLRVWVDANGNGVTDPGELLSLAQLGIVSINLDATPDNETIWWMSLHNSAGPHNAVAERRRLCYKSQTASKNWQIVCAGFERRKQTHEMCR